MEKALAELIRISNIAGKDSTLVQGGGGNTSVKTDDGQYLYIKASGTALKDMSERKGWRRLRMDSVLAIIGDKSLTQLADQAREVEVVNRLLLSCDDDVKDGSRPSVEAHLHAYLDKCIIHLHPNVVGAFVNAKKGKAELEKLFADEKYPFLWVPYTDPGFMLAKKISQLTSDYQKQHGRKPAILFLEKHGLFVSAQTPDEGLKLVHKVISRCESKLIVPKANGAKTIETQLVADTKLCIRKAYHEATGEYIMISYFYDDAVKSFLAQKDAHKLLSAGVLTPDELVYANGASLWIDKCDSKKIAEKLKAQIAKGAKPAAAFLVKGVGLFIAATEKIVPTVKDVTASSFFIRINAARMSGIFALTQREQDFINKWESEAFRKKIAGGSCDGDLKNRIAIVTGAGSGLGRSIATGLARAGAAVVIADIDTKAAQETYEIIKAQMPQTQMMVTGCNVTDEDSVNKSFENLIKNWGGLDILVNAAGVAPAYSLIDLPVDKWRFALEVNLTGYFLMAKVAAKIMIKQAMAGSIINISSKSGLDASKNNTPYNATKAGELHMARGWAMELGEYGIRVNSVCPGNVFEGSKIWNPDYIKTCAKKYGIKPEEVIPYYVNKTTLKREIKGQDIADSVVFLCSDKARCITGQTIVADSGQVMVR
jgi:NAD(P)-dependent dehydrogenase (short-subunit alcohol dehydrogenase family)/rhamnose utilization protein RhaD (predicted bifunctional aldolase and dehydrogenase)